MKTKEDIPAGGAVHAVQTISKCCENCKTVHHHFYTQKALLLW